MDKNAIKKYAVWARRELIERVSQKALQYGITADGKADPNADSVNGRLLTDAEKKQRRELIRKVNAHGYEQVMEEIAYTWFNRFAALRFMEVNGYLPSHVRVFTNDAGEFRPQILAEAIHLELDGLDMDRVYELKNANKDEELFKYLLVTQCNALSPILPKMFQRIADDTELLLPDYLLREGSVIHQMIAMIPEEDWRDQVQIIGWLYQYYNTEPKDKVFADLKKNIKITKENIPAATQLFTPDWIVRYMVENSLGRLWLEGHPNDALKSEWKYYLDEAEQEPEVQAQLAEIRKEYAALKPEDIRCIDPCMGSGHILCYLFDVLVRIYEDYGYTAREAVGSIVEKNLWGLDIDDRAAQLAYFAVMMKARQYDRRFFAHPVQPNVYSPKGYLDGEEFGSLLTVDELEPIPMDIAETTLFDESYETKLNRWNFRQALAQKYHVVCTNPPYMAVSNAGGKLQEYIKKNFPDSKTDLFAVFIEQCRRFAAINGYQAMITQQSWMFTATYETLRKKLSAITLINFLQFGARGFDEISGEVVQTASFVFCKRYVPTYIGSYMDLTVGDNEAEKESIFQSRKKLYLAVYSDFANVPNASMAYWLSHNAIICFRDKKISDQATTREGMTTADNERFLRYWHEIVWDKVCTDCTSIQGATDSNCKWFPYNKGGQNRKWYGNNDLVVNWENDGFEIKKITDEKTGRIRSHNYNAEYSFRASGTWTAICSGDIMVRYSKPGALFDSKGASVFASTGDNLYFIIGMLNSKVSGIFLKVLSPSYEFKVGHVANVPLRCGHQAAVIERVSKSILLSKIDWDSFETSWDFIRHPLVRGVSTVAEAYAAWAAECDARFNQLKANEEELNRIFIDIYGLQDELTPEVEDKDVTVRRADLGRDIRSLISYAVGCMFGRYSLDVNGLAYAGGEWDAAKYTTFQPGKDAILPVCDDDYFEDDIMGRFVQWVETVYGGVTLEENLKFIADALGGKGSPREVIRNYFLNGFYADHCKVYQKRPIYWLFDSGKKNGFKCLIYMHRYQPDTIARIRTDYVHEQQARYRTAITDLEQRINGASTSERVKLNKRLAALQAQAAEIRGYEEKIHHLADQMIKIDLDDGVKKNYALFQDVLANIK